MVFVGGCASIESWKSDDDYTTKIFQNGALEYRIEYDAVESMNKMETLLKGLDIYSKVDQRAKKQMINILYRDADSNRDYCITKKEAKNFANRMSKNYEFNLGDFSYK
ncbi:hypothetical protein MNBD_BACTEROID05-320 [hydrothermal vent metagenome]|uniref:Uncharacterized protein n=1 Tax=hydrothermal vent metagenome TaxID=652676 RepID=A0A3B0T3X8_9ZZZZ